VKKSLDEFYGVPSDTAEEASSSTSVGSKPIKEVKPTFRKVYIQYKTRETGAVNPMDEGNEQVSQRQSLAKYDHA